MALTSVVSKFTSRLRRSEKTAKVTERRLVNRVLNYWDAQRGDRPFPSLSDIDPQDIPDDWQWCFVLEVREPHHFPYFHHLGSELARYNGIFLGGDRDWTMTLLDKAVENYAQVVERREMVLVEDEITRFDRKTLLFRAIMLPLSEDQTTIDYVLGAANGKLIED